MAKAATTKSDEPKKKKRKAAAAPVVKVKVKAKKAKTKTKQGAYEGLAKLVDHPMVADLLAAGAIAAVAAIAEHQAGKGKGETSSKMVKSIGKAAATAMGAKLFGDIGAISTAASNAAKKKI